MGKGLMIVALIGAIWIGAGYAQSQDGSAVKFELNPIDSLMSPCRVGVEAVFTNLSDSTIVLYHHGSFGFSGAIGFILNFSIVSNRQDTASKSIMTAMPLSPHRLDTVQLAPGAVYREVLVLNNYYSLAGDTVIADSSRVTADDPWAVLHRRCWPSGAYTIQATYEYRHNPSWTGGRALWQGKAVSNRVDIAVE